MSYYYYYYYCCYYCCGFVISSHTLVPKDACAFYSVPVYSENVEQALSHLLKFVTLLSSAPLDTQLLQFSLEVLNHWTGNLVPEGLFQHRLGYCLDLLCPHCWWKVRTARTTTASKSQGEKTWVNEQCHQQNSQLLLLRNLSKYLQRSCFKYAGTLKWSEDSCLNRD